MHGAPAPVVRIDTSFGNASSLEIVEQRDHRAGVHARQRCEFLLRDPRALRHDRHQAELARMKAMRLQQRDEAAPRFLAEVTQEKAGVPRELFGWLIRIE